MNGHSLEFGVSPIVTPGVIERGKPTLWHECVSRINSVSNEFKTGGLATSILFRPIITDPRIIKCNDIKIHHKDGGIEVGVYTSIILWRDAKKESKIKLISENFQASISLIRRSYISENEKTELYSMINNVCIRYSQE
jgi:hypothetical protein